MNLFSRKLALLLRRYFVTFRMSRIPAHWARQLLASSHGVWEGLDGGINVDLDGYVLRERTRK